VSKENLASVYNMPRNDIAEKDQLVGICILDLDLRGQSAVYKSVSTNLHQEKFDKLKRDFV
jgi:hypothetical protein